MKINKLDVINYLLILLTGVFGFFLANGQFIFASDHNTPFVLWHVVLTLSLLVATLGALIAINIIKKRYRPNYVLIGILGVLFLSNMLTILLFKNPVNYNYTGIDGEACSFTFELSDFSKFSYIMQFFGFISVVLLLLDIVHQVVDGQRFVKHICYLALIVIPIFIIYSYIKEFSSYINLFKGLFNGDAYAYAVASAFKSKNNYAYILNIGIIASILLHHSNKKRYWFIVMAFLYINLCFTLSKLMIAVDFILINAYLLYHFFLSYKENKKRNIIALCSVVGAYLLVFIILLIILAATGKLASFFEIITSTKGQDTLETRKWIWDKSGLVLSHFNYFTGAGFNLYGDLLFNYNINDWATRAINETRSAHNGFIQLIGDGGILMLLAFLFISIILVITAVKNYKNNKEVVTISLFIFLVTLVCMIFESCELILPRSIEYGTISAMVFIPILAINKQAKEKVN